MCGVRRAAHGPFDATSQAQMGFHTFHTTEEIRRQGGGRGLLVGSGEVRVCGRPLYLKRDPLVLSGLTEGVSEEEDVIHSDTQSQEG